MLAAAHRIKLGLTRPQRQFVTSDSKFPAFVGGFGAGKSEALVGRLLIKKLQYPKCDVGYFAPTFDLIRLIAWPRFEAKLEEWGLKYRLNKSENTIKLATGGQVIFRTLDTPDRIVGFEISDAGIDELDTLKKAHAQNAWNKVIARCRQKKPDGAANTAAVATTPEGFKLVYDLWQKNIRPGYQLIRAPTGSNPFLPAGYIDQLRATYPPQLLAAYLEGEFVNLVSGGVYLDFDRQLNASSETVQAGDALHIGADFNVLNGTAIISVWRGANFHSVAELTGLRDTPAMARSIKERYAGHRINVYPDASGASHKSTNASASDLSILREAGFNILAKGVNPPVRDRIASVNAAILNGLGKRTWFVNSLACPSLTEALEQQVYDKNGDPDKTSGLDHAVDAVGYPITYLMPVAKAGRLNVSELRM